jgi:hypothetical protein
MNILGFTCGDLPSTEAAGAGVCRQYPSRILPESPVNPRRISAADRIRDRPVDAVPTPGMRGSGGI